MRERSEEEERRKTNSPLFPLFFFILFLAFLRQRDNRERAPPSFSLLSAFDMSLQATTTRNTITLKGSSKIVTEFFAYAVNR